MTIPALTPEVIEARGIALYEVDDNSCQRCGAKPPETAADDPRWYVDTVLVPNESVPSEPVTIAVIYCPTCW